MKNSPGNIIKSDQLQFFDDQSNHVCQDKEAEAQLPWKVMVIDDDKSAHDVTVMVLNGFEYEGRGLHIISGYSVQDVYPLLEEYPDTAVIFLDMVMETEQACLDVVRYIREELKNRFIRIILCTGQSGYAPKTEIVIRYDINDYKDKSDLTAVKLNNTLVVALRSYQDLKTIHSLTMSNEILEQRVNERTLALSQIERELKQETLKKIESENRLLEVQRVARIGSWEWELNSNKLIFSDQIFSILNLTKDNSELNYNSLLEWIHNEDRNIVKYEHEKAIKEKRPFFSIEHRIVLPDKSVRYVSQQGEVVEVDGELTKIVGTFQDITDRYTADQEMKKLSLAVEQIADSIMITDVNGKIEYVNSAFEEITGYKRTEIIGQTPRILKSDAQNKKFYRRLWECILNGEVFSDVIINRRKDEVLYYEEKTITPLKDVLGKITHFISSGKDITERMESQKLLKHLAHHDNLTGMPNRLLFQDRLYQAMSRVSWHKRTVAILFIDLDRFKRINDTLGHEVGDQLLCETAERLNSCVREGDTVARLGGDEFSVILNDLASRDDISPICEKIIYSLTQPFVINGNELFVSASIGIAQFPLDGEDNKTLLKKADMAMYEAKAQGGESYCFYSEQNNSGQFERLSLESKLRRALENGEFYLHYQPQLHLKSVQVISREVLLRWSHSEFSDITPNIFIPVLEETGLISPVGEWVMLQACRDEMVRQKSGFAPQRVAVNLSIRQFKRSDFVSRVENILNQTGIQADCLELEVTEGLLIKDIPETARTLHELHELGVKLSIDDFGTGYSSMNYLKRLPFDTLKIDQSFVRDIMQNKDDAAITSAIITLAHSMELEVVAEGVETMEQLQFLYRQGCDLIQGFLFNRPMSFDKVDEFEQVNPEIKQFLDTQSTII